jgi:DHA3 family tetracycline resistance protein-like MFS transporter
MSLRKMDAYRVYLMMTGGMALFFTLVFTVNMIYQVQTVGLSPLQLVLVGTTLELSVFLFEIPTGVVADVYSRRLSIIIGFLLVGAGFLVEGLVPTFGAILVGQVLWGLGYTFTSGAVEAWITDEIGEEKVGRAFLRGSQVGSLVGLAGTVIAVALGSLLINLPIVLGGALFLVLAAFLLLFMPENGFQPKSREERSSWGHMADTLRQGLRLVRGRPALWTILGIGLFYGLFSEGVDRLWMKFMLDSYAFPTWGGFQPVVWFGLMGMAGNLLSVLATQVVVKRVKTENPTALARVGLATSGMMVTCIAGLALSGSLLVAVLFQLGFGVLRSVIDPIYTTWLNRNIDSDVRATVISMSGQVDAVGQIAGGPVVGVIGNLSIRAALLASSAILSPTIYLYGRALRREPQAKVLPIAGEPS